MSYSAIQNIPIAIDLKVAANDTGWSIGDGTATHVACNSGYVRLKDYTVKAGHTYRISYAVLVITSGYVQLFAGVTGGLQRTVSGFYTETITPTSDGSVSFFSNGNCTIKAFNSQDTAIDTSNTQKNTIVWSFQDRSWSEFRTIAPDFGFSLYIDMLTLFGGNLYLHQNGSSDRNNFYGNQYNSIIRLLGNSQPASVHKFKSISLQSNELLITTARGITTSLGQVSELTAQDFLKYNLTDTSGTASVYTYEGVYSSQLLNDMNTDLINGDPLKGNWILVELQTADGSLPLQLFTVGINDSLSKIGVR